LSKDVSLFKSEAKGTVQELQEVVGDTQTKLQLIYARIGTDNVASDLGTMSVWESIRKTQGDVNDGATKMEALDGEVSLLGLGFTKEQNSIAHLSEIVARQKDQFAAFVDKYQQNLKYTKRTFAGMEAKFAELSGHIGAGSADDPMDLGDLNLEDRALKSATHSNGVLAALMEWIDRLESQHRAKIPKSTGYDVSGITLELEARLQAIER
jgi:hypothetical protein